MICSPYDYPTYQNMVVVNAVFNGLLALTMNYLCSARWLQMSKSIPHHDILRKCVNSFFTVLCFLKILSQFLAVYNSGGTRASTFVNVTASMLAILSIIFDLIITFLIAKAVFEAHMLVSNDARNASANIRRMRRFKCSLIGLLTLDIVQLTITIGFIKLPQYTGAAISTSIGTFVIHVFVSTELLKGFVGHVLKSKTSKTSANNKEATGQADNGRYIASNSLKARASLS